jgi:hypothetical protein
MITPGVDETGLMVTELASIWSLVSRILYWPSPRSVMAFEIGVSTPSLTRYRVWFPASPAMPSRTDLSHALYVTYSSSFLMAIYGISGRSSSSGSYSSTAPF